jgi:hypothetical protein
MDFLKIKIWYHFSKFKIYLCKYLKFGMNFHQNSKNFLQFLLFVSDFYEFLKSSKYEQYQTGLSVQSARFRSFSKKLSSFITMCEPFLAI